LVHGQHLTNNVFPANLAKHGALPGLFTHNNITLYVATPLAALFGGLGGWLATNLLCSSGSALLVFLLLRKRSARAAALVASFFLLLPLTVWLTSNALSEPIYTFFATLCLFVWLRAKTPLGQWLFVAAALAAALAKDNLAILFLVPIANLWMGWGEGRNRLPASVRAVAMTGSGLVLFAVLRSIIFVENVQYTMAARLISAIPPKNDIMAPYFLTSAPNFEWAIFWAKLARNIPALVRFAPEDLPFILPYFVLLGMFLWRLGKNRKKLQSDCEETRAILMTAFLILSYFATVLFYANQMRYTQFVIPSLFISISLYVEWTERKVKILGAFLGCLVPVALALAFHIHKEEIKQSAETRSIEQCIDSHLAQGTPLLVVRDKNNEFGFIEIAYAVRPRTALIVEQQDFCEQLEQYRTRFNLRYAFGKASFLAQRGASIAGIEGGAGRYAGYGIYDIQSSCP
jgi:4-amino-4-deoxy-L-arabinose transferase-like glycosyltransferase